MHSLRAFIIGVLFLTVSPTAALADGLFVPFFGTNFGGDTGGLEEGVDADRFTWGASIGWMGGGVIGVENPLRSVRRVDCFLNGDNDRVLFILQRISASSIGIAIRIVRIWNTAINRLRRGYVAAAINRDRINPPYWARAKLQECGRGLPRV